MKHIADKYKIDSSQIPILWAISKGTVPIVGITKPSHATKLVTAIEITLTEQEIDLIEKEATATGIRQLGNWELQ